MSMYGVFDEKSGVEFSFTTIGSALRHVAYILPLLSDRQSLIVKHYDIKPDVVKACDSFSYKGFFVDDDNSKVEE